MASSLRDRMAQMNKPSVKAQIEEADKNKHSDTMRPTTPKQEDVVPQTSPISEIGDTSKSEVTKESQSVSHTQIEEIKAEEKLTPQNIVPSSPKASSTSSKPKETTNKKTAENKNEAKAEAKKTENSNKKDVKEKASTTEDAIKPLVLTHENMRYIKVRSKQLDAKIETYINCLIREEKARYISTEEEEIRIYELMHNKNRGNKERTSTKLSGANIDFLVETTKNIGISITDYLNYIIDNEMKYEKENGKRETLDKDEI